jgi:hypothetical protein
VGPLPLEAFGSGAGLFSEDFFTVPQAAKTPYIKRYLAKWFIVSPTGKYMMNQNV